MDAGVTITVTDPDDDYHWIEVVASNGRFMGSAGIYAGPDDVARFADMLEGFPSIAGDRRDFELSSKVTGEHGRVDFHFHTVGGFGHSVLEIEVVDDAQMNSLAQARFIIPVEAASVDRFVESLRALSPLRSGVARLEASG